MSKTKAGGTTKNIHDSPGKRLGVKVFGGQDINTGSIIVRQVGRNKLSGVGTRMGKDFTIYAARSGTVSFKKRKITSYDGSVNPRTEVQVI